MSYLYCQNNTHNSPKSETTKKCAYSKSKAKKTQYQQNASLWKGLASICEQFKIHWCSCFILSNTACNEDFEETTATGGQPVATSHTPQGDQAPVILAPTVPLLHHRPTVCFLLLFFYISNLLFWWLSNMKCSLKNVIIFWTITFDRFRWPGELTKAQGWRRGTGSTLTCQQPHSGHKAELLLLQATLGANPLPELCSLRAHRRHWAGPAVLSPPAASAPPLPCVQKTSVCINTDKCNFYVNSLETGDNAIKRSIVQCNCFYSIWCFIFFFQGSSVSKDY